MLPRWFAPCLLLAALAGFTHAQSVKIELVGVHKAAECAAPLAALQRELHEMPYPPGWTIYIACTGTAWDDFWRRAGGPRTDKAFTCLHAHFTVLNGAIFLELRNEYRQVIAHELGHIACDCRDEWIAAARSDRFLSTQRVTSGALARSGPVEDERPFPRWVAALH